MLNVDLSISEDDGQGVLALDGDFYLDDAPAVTSHLVAAIAACGPSVIVDLAALDSIGFAGLGVLLRIRKWSRNSGGDLPLAAPRPPVRQVLEAAGLIDVFSIYPNVDEAARAVRQAQHPKSPVPAPTVLPSTVPVSTVPASTVPAAPLSVPPPARRGIMPWPAGRQPAYRRFYRPPTQPLYQSGRCRCRELNGISLTIMQLRTFMRPQTPACYLP